MGQGGPGDKDTRGKEGPGGPLATPIFAAKPSTINNKYPYITTGPTNLF